MDFFRKVTSLIKNPFTRYLLATELYMVEPWEQVVVHIVFGVCFVAFWYFNYLILQHFMKQEGNVSQIQSFAAITN